MNVLCEVLVVGGGVAGVPAAVAAARAGADTLLIEKRTYPGGAGVAGLHRHLCGLYRNDPIASASLLNHGLAEEVCERLRMLAPATGPMRLGKVDVLPYDSSHLQKVFVEMIEGEDHLRVLYETAADRFDLEAGQIRCAGANGMDIMPHVVVDCSGEGVVIQCDASLHEAPPGKRRQLAGFTVQISGLIGVNDALPIEVPYFVRRGVEAQALPEYLRFTAFMPGDAPGEGWCKLSLPAGQIQADQARHDAERLHDYLKQVLPAFRSSRLATHASEVMEREGPRLKGLYTLTDRNVLEGKKFPDSVVQGAWPIEIWDADRGPVYRYLDAGTTYDIPLRCLQAAAARNLLCAGRCISVTHEALGSTRVMGTCLALGEAAGAQAARLSRGEA